MRKELPFAYILRSVLFAADSGDKQRRCQYTNCGSRSRILLYSAKKLSGDEQHLPGFSLSGQPLRYLDSFFFRFCAYITLSAPVTKLKISSPLTGFAIT